jgi:hypothetical protein
MAVEFKDIIELIKAIAWPTVVVTTVILLRKPLAKFISELGGRATKVSFFQFAIELTTMPEFKATWSVGSDDVRKLSPATVFDSAAQSLFNQIADSTASDYAIIDLGKEKHWLTSRLYIFAVMLERMRNLECLVFLETQGDTRRRFLGVASPSQVRWALAQRYPWLEAAFAEAYSEVSPKPPNTAFPYILSAQGGLQTYTANDLARHFIEKIQQNVAPTTDAHEWVTLEQQLLWEHAAWLDGDRRQRDLADILQMPWVLDSVDTPANKRARAVLRRDGLFVALVDEEGIFRSLVDRQALLEQVGRHYAEPTEDESVTKQ